MAKKTLKATKDKSMTQLMKELGEDTVARHIAKSENKEATKTNLDNIKERIKKPKKPKEISE